MLDQLHQPQGVCCIYSTKVVSNIAKVYADTSGADTFNNVRITSNVNFSQFDYIIMVWSY